MHLFGWGKNKDTADFSFRVDDVFHIKGHGVVVTGQVTAGKVRKGVRVTCVKADGTSFPCLIQKIEQPDPSVRGQFVHPDYASADGPFQGSYAFWIADRQPSDFRPGDRLIAGENA